MDLTFRQLSASISFANKASFITSGTLSECPLVIWLSMGGAFGQAGQQFGNTDQGQNTVALKEVQCSYQGGTLGFSAGRWLLLGCRPHVTALLLKQHHRYRRASWMIQPFDCGQHEDVIKPQSSTGCKCKPISQFSNIRHSNVGILIWS